MSGSVNKVLLIGNIGHDPSIRETQSRGRVAMFSLATTRSTKDAGGERQYITEWHNIVILADKLVEFAENYLHKGSKVCVQGELRTRKWTDKKGNERRAVEVVLPPFSGELTNLTPREREPTPDENSYNSGDGDAPPAIDDEIPF